LVAGRQKAGSGGQLVFRAIRVILGLVAVLLVLTQIILEPVVVASESMRPTLLVGDRALVFKLAYGIRFGDRWWRWAAPARGDVVSIRGRGSEHTVTRRVLAVAGDEIELEGGAASVNGRPLATTLTRSNVGCLEVSIDRLVGGVSDDSCELWTERNGNTEYGVLRNAPASAASRKWRVPEGKVLVLGDNRGNTNDVDLFGGVPVDDVIGRIGVVGWSVGETTGGGASGSTRWRRTLLVINRSQLGSP
jgi:signal peptidase I